MTTVTISMDAVINRSDLERLLGAIEPSVLLKVVGQKLIGFVNQSFETRGRGGWAPLSAATVAMRLGGSSAPLQDTGHHYKQSFTSDMETDNQTYVEVGSNVKTPDGQHSIAKIHEYGVTVRVIRRKVLAAQSRGGVWFHFGKEITIPARPVLPTQQQAVDLLKPALEEMLEITKEGPP